MVNPAPATPTNENAKAWYRQLNGYHWLVLVVATMAWSFFANSHAAAYR